MEKILTIIIHVGMIVSILFGIAGMVTRDKKYTILQWFCILIWGILLVIRENLK